MEQKPKPQVTGADLLWGGPPAAKRGPKPALSIDQLTRAAITAADADGLTAVSMQRVADELGSTKMALYRYVPGKAELVALMIDTAVGEPPELHGMPGGWREWLGEWALRMLAAFQAHPWLVEATVGPRVIGPHELGWLECALLGLDGTALEGGEKIDAVALLAGHIRTITQQSASANPEQQMSAALGEVLRTHGERYPAFMAAMTSAAVSGTQDKGLEFGIERILDGLGMLMRSRTGEAR